MKNFAFYTLLVLISGLSMPVRSQQNNAERQVIATLDDGENFIYGESCFLLAADKTDAYFVTKMGGKFYVHDNGTRKGPYSELKADMLRTGCAGINPLCAVFNSADCMKEEAYAKYVTTDQNNYMTIKAGGKTMGPYMAVMQFAITCDATKFAALVMKMDNSIHFIHSNGKDLVINGLPQWLLLSADGEQAIAAFGKTIDPSKIDMSTVNMADFTNFQVIDLNGEIYGPYTVDQSVNGTFWFCKTGGAHWFMTKAGQILRDGKAYRGELEGYGSCDIWISTDGSQIALVDYGQGTVTESSSLWLIRNPLEITSYQQGGKNWIKWISLENNGKVLVAYKKVF